MFYIPLIVVNLILGSCGEFLFKGTLNMQVGDEVSIYESPKGVITSMSLEILAPETMHGDIVAVVRLSDGDNENIRKDLLHIGDRIIVDTLCGKYLEFSGRNSYIAKFSVVKR